MEVKLVSFTGCPGTVVSSAARLCYSSDTPDDIIQKMYDDESSRVKLINKIISMGHTSVLEHASFTFAISGISRVLTHQLVRHRMASYSQRSQRYVDEVNANFVVPPSIVANEQAMERYKQAILEVANCYKELQELGIPNEDARYVLANSAHSCIFVTMNARELMLFFKERLCTRAQWEIRTLAEQMASLAKQVTPEIFVGHVGPACIVNGRCTQGALSCKPNIKKAPGQVVELVQPKEEKEEEAINEEKDQSV